MTALEELDTQVPDNQCSVGFQLFASLLRRRGGWFANKSLEPTRVGAFSSASRFTPLNPAWLSLGLGESLNL
jgi:hypothetical protein